MSHAKTTIKRAVKGVGAMLGRALPARTAVARILTYHSVGSRDHEMNVSPPAFREQMEWLARSANVIPLAEAAASRPGVAVTFDDGYRDNLVHAAPVLEDLGIPATVFVVAGRRPDPSRPPRAARPAG